MQQYATKQDMMTDNTAFYKTVKAISKYRNESFAFDNLWQKDNVKAWQVVNTASQKTVSKYAKWMYAVIVKWLILFFLVVYKMPGVQDGILEYKLMSPMDKALTGRFGRLWLIVKNFGWQEYTAITVFIIITGVISSYWGKWMMKKVMKEVNNLL